MGLDSEFQEKLASLHKQIQNQIPSRSLIVKLLSLQNFQSWLLLDKLISYYEEKNQRDFQKVLDIINDEAPHNLASITMLIYLYGLKANVKKTLFLYRIRWDGFYTDIALKSGDIIMFSSWILSESKANIVQQTLGMVCDIFPKFFKKEYLSLNMHEFNAILEWVTLFQTTNINQLNSVIDLSQIIFDKPIPMTQDYIKKEHFILKKIIEIAGQHQNASPNIFVFIYPYVLTEKQINYFCYINNQFLLDLTEDNLINFFRALTKGSISKEALAIINKISQILQSEEEYFKLRVIFQKFVLPVLISRAKACKDLEGDVFDIAETYILGFLNHCTLGKEGISFCLKNYGKIKNKEVQVKWLGLFYLLSERYPQQKSFIQEEFSKQMKAPIKFPEISYQLKNPEIVWLVSERNSRKHKKYIKVPSKYQGIKNPSNYCYIISTVQALYHTQKFMSLLDSYRTQIKQKYFLLDQMRVLFSELSGRKQSKDLTVEYLKKKGPKYFAESHQQEDVQQYIIELFAALEEQGKKVEGFLPKFKALFESTINIDVTCLKCNNSCKNKESTYTYTIPNTETLSPKTQEHLSQYQCIKCNKNTDCRVSRQISLTSEILIVHINRFSHQKGLTKKQLFTAKIMRVFMGYQLVGMICHVGKNVENGHYLYYGKISEKRWAKFNDLLVEQFELDQENEQFQNEMKAETTPYILLYQRIQK